jgi:1,3-beta-glucanosyltransferase GAS3
LDPAANHDDCVSIFNAVGMYMILDVNSPLANGALSRSDPGASYNKVYMEHVFSVIEAFKDYPNLLALFAGNEVINQQAVIQVPAYIRVRRP